MRRGESDGSLWWGALGAGVGLVAGFALGEWVGDVNRPRLRRAARRLQTPSPTRLTAAAGARAAGAAIAAEPALAEYRLEALPIGAGAVELRGWVTSRAARALAARRVRAVPGVESVINSILVRGEDDLRTAETEASDQSA